VEEYGNRRTSEDSPTSPSPQPKSWPSTAHTLSGGRAGSAHGLMSQWTLDELNVMWMELKNRYSELNEYEDTGKQNRLQRLTELQGTNAALEKNIGNISEDSLPSRRYLILRWQADRDHPSRRPGQGHDLQPQKQWIHDKTLWAYRNDSTLVRTLI